MSYMVMECHPGYAILLDEEGRFLKAANLRYEVGQTVYDPIFVKDNPSEKKHGKLLLKSGILAAAACFLLFFGINYYHNYIEVYSSVYLAINPQVRMELNRQGEVVELVGTNKDGMTLLEGYDAERKDKAIVDFKYVKDIYERFYTRDSGVLNFIQYWGYDFQLAIYQKVVELNTGKKLPCFINAIDKTKEPNLELIQITQPELDSAIIGIPYGIERINLLKSGKVNPDRCGQCDYCKSTKVITKPILMSALLQS